MAIPKTFFAMLLTFALTPAFATVLYSPYAGNNPGAANDQDEVIGMNGQFDIQSVAFTIVNSLNVTVLIDFNYNFGDVTLSPFTDSGFTFHPGDLLFSSAGPMWGVALASHPGFTAGSLYSVDHFLTAGDVLGFPSNASYDPSGQVWMDDDGQQELIDAGTSSTSSLGGDEVQTTLSFDPGASLYEALSGGTTEVDFASATCANDFISGTIPAIFVPEPSAFALLSASFLGLGILCRLRRRS